MRILLVSDSAVPRPRRSCTRSCLLHAECWHLGTEFTTHELDRELSTASCRPSQARRKTLVSPTIPALEKKTIRSVAVRGQRAVCPLCGHWGAWEAPEGNVAVQPGKHARFPLPPCSAFPACPALSCPSGTAHPAGGQGRSITRITGSLHRPPR